MAESDLAILVLYREGNFIVADRVGIDGAFTGNFDVFAAEKIAVANVAVVGGVFGFVVDCKVGLESAGAEVALEGVEEKCAAAD